MLCYYVIVGVYEGTLFNKKYILSKGINEHYLLYSFDNDFVSVYFASSDET